MIPNTAYRTRINSILSKKGERDKLKKVRENFIFMDIDVKDEK